ncbi:MAG: hypothetical protein WCJ02_14380 [bacterium]
MTIDKHLKIAGSIQAGVGIMGALLCIATVVFIFYDIFRPFGGDYVGSDMFVFNFFMLILFSLICGFQIWFGCSLAQQKRWATRVVGFIWCFFGLFNFPLGTAINGYTLWILVQIDKIEAIRSSKEGA